MTKHRFEDAVQGIAAKLFGKSGTPFFESLALELTQFTEFDLALVGEVRGHQIQALAVAEDGNLLDPFVYDIEGTPCANVIENEYDICSYPRDVATLFPKDLMLHEMGLEAYLGATLIDPARRSVGLIALMHRQPIENDELARSLLAIFVHQTATELSRGQEAARINALQSFHREVLERMPIQLAVFDLERRFQYLNPAAVSDPEMRRWLIGKTEFDYCEERSLPPSLAENRRTYLDAVRTTGEAVSYEETLDSRAGEEQVYLRSVHPVPDEAGEIQQLLGFGFDITQQKRTEKELRESEAAYRAMFEENCAIKLLIDPATLDIVDANRAACEFYGVSLETLRQKQLSDFARTSASDDLKSTLDAARRGDLEVFQGRHRIAEGDVADVEIHIGPIEIRSRQLLFAIVQDISDRCRAEEKVREREAYFRALIQHALDVITILDRDGVVRFETPSIQSVLGYDPDQRLGTTMIASVHPDDQELFSTLIEEAALGQTPATSVEYRCQNAHGEWRVIESRAANRLHDPVVQGIILHSRDVTERRRAEEAVRKSEEKYRRLFEQSKDVVYMSSPEGYLLDINQAGIDLLGYEGKEELLKLDLKNELYATPWHRDLLQEEIDRAGFVKDFEIQMKPRNGQVLNALVTSSAVTDSSDQVIAYLGILRDVTSQRQLEDQFRQSQKMEAVGRLAGGLAHDFNNLLTAINGYGELLQHQLPKDDPRRTYVDEICNAGRRAADLTAKLLTLSRRKVVSPRVVDLNRMVGQLQNLLRRLIGEDIELATDLATDLYPVQVDPGQMEQVLLNLAINARDAMPTGGRLKLATCNLLLDGQGRRLPAHLDPGPYVRLSVSDNGIGMDPEVKQHIFEPFFTTKAQGEGTGLGLSTAYATIQQSGGHITVESIPNQGTTFHLFLPKTQAGMLQEDSPDELEESQMGDETILLVEDDPSVRRLVRRILEQQGYRVLSAANPRKALELVMERGSEIDLLLSDVVMPAMSGPDLAAKISRHRPQIRILFISGYTDDKFTGRHGLSDKEHAVLQKPFNAHTLSEKVREVLDRSWSSMGDVR